MLKTNFTAGQKHVYSLVQKKRHTLNECMTCSLREWLLWKKLWSVRVHYISLKGTSSNQNIRVVLISHRVLLSTNVACSLNQLFLKHGNILLQKQRQIHRTVTEDGATSARNVKLFFKSKKTLSFKLANLHTAGVKSKTTLQPKIILISLIKWAPGSCLAAALGPDISSGFYMLARLHSAWLQHTAAIAHLSPNISTHCCWNWKTI